MCRNYKLEKHVVWIRDVRQIETDDREPSILLASLTCRYDITVDVSNGRTQ